MAEFKNKEDSLKKKLSNKNILNSTGNYTHWLKIPFKEV